jgi:hypothetical protein
MEYGPNHQPIDHVGRNYNLWRAATALIVGLGMTALGPPAASAAKDSANDAAYHPGTIGYTTIRDAKNGMYLGYADGNEGDSFTIAGKQRFADAPYGVVYISAIDTYKCGYINPSLPAGNAPAVAVNFCAKDQHKIDKRKGIYERMNCPEKNGNNTCDGPTHFTRIRKPCTGTLKRVYRNFTPAGKNILNVMGKNLEEPFSDVVTSNTEVSSVHFRTKSKFKGQNGVPAAVVMSDDVDEQLGWGWFRFKCLQPNQLRDGSPADN